jgi:anti-sigma B factor antagonist
MRPAAVDTHPDFSVEVDRAGRERVVVRVHGAVDLFAAPELKRELLETIERGVLEIILDLSGTAFLDSTGLGALLTAHKRLAARDGQLTIVNGVSGVERVFQITGLDSIFSFAPSVDDALAEGRFARGL